MKGRADVMVRFKAVESTYKGKMHKVIDTYILTNDNAVDYKMSFEAAERAALKLNEQYLQSDNYLFHETQFKFRKAFLNLANEEARISNSLGERLNKIIKSPGIKVDVTMTSNHYRRKVKVALTNGKDIVFGSDVSYSLELNDNGALVPTFEPLGGMGSFIPQLSLARVDSIMIQAWMIDNVDFLDRLLTGKKYLEALEIKNQCATELDKVRRK